jgi:hypothetical protein
VSAYTKEYCDSGIAGLIEDKHYKPESELMAISEDIKKIFEGKSSGHSC